MDWGSLIGLLGSGLGAFAGIVVNSKMTNYRLEQLERKVEEHNNYGREIPLIKKDVEDMKEKFKKLESKGVI